MKDHAKIIRQARDIRGRLIESEKKPHGSCYEASAALGFKLARLGIEASFVCGNVSLPGGNRPCHYWLEVDGLILDITGDQFNFNAAKEVPPVLFESYEYNPAYLVRDKGPIPYPSQWAYGWARKVWFDVVKQ